MEEREKKKEKLIGKLLGKYADSRGISIIKMGDNNIHDDTNRRLRTACNAYKKQIESLTSRLARSQAKLSEYSQEERLANSKNSLLQQEVDTLKIEVKNITKQLEESNSELEIRRQEEDRFTILDL